MYEIKYIFVHCRITVTCNDNGNILEEYCCLTSGYI